MRLLWTTLCRYLPESLAACLRAVPISLRDAVQEVRLRCGEKLMLSTRDGGIRQSIIVDAAMVHETFLRCCQHAVHTHQEELAQGFVTTAQGYRVGVAGTAVIKDGRITSCRDITSLCIRLPRKIRGCAAPLLSYVDGTNGVTSLLLCGAPASGKTTLLRDLAMTLCESHAVSVVDERREISAFGCGACDVLRGYPKGEGVLQAVRTMSPEAVVVDELGSHAEWEAVIRSCYCGVAVIASAHIADPHEALARPLLTAALQNGAFEWVAFLPPRRRIYEETVIVKARDLLENTGSIADRVRLYGHGTESGVVTAL